MTPADLALAQRLADAAGAAIRPFFRKRFAMEAKADHSPVTEADRAAEAAMRAILAAERPDDGVIGEEYGSDRPDAERVWVLDPIDGTRSFVAGRPIFGTLVALVEAKTPVLGIIDQPIAGERWIGAAGAATTLNGAAVTTRACAALAGAHLATTGPGYFGGFLPFINQYIVAKTGDPLAGLWYTIGVTAVALLIVSLAVPETSGKELE